MESAISLRYTPWPTPTATFRLSSRSIGVRASRSVHLSLSHASLPHCSLRHQAAHVSGRVNCMLDENERFSVPSKKEGRDNNVIRGMTGLSLVMACVVGVFNFSNKMNPKLITAYASFFRPNNPVQTSSETRYPVVQFDRAEFALASVLEMVKHTNSQGQTQPQIKSFSKDEIDRLKLYAAGQTKSQNPDEAYQILKKEYEKLKKQREGGPEQKQNLEMAMIEILILQGKYEEAQKLLDSRIDKIIGGSGEPNNYGRKLSDDEKIERLEYYSFGESKPKIFLYKAVLHTMLGNKEAAKWGKAFGDKI
ncbi:hypothetical protein L6164_031848 [Bauhinia variegata]|uniref:Uncharacterized protein n=1 Tax=Bauhinia variegata TaxID=167791 RepID=A0ACB9KLU8_BAUVA|nr:hypothetical protein L6164_031848 [Bauhinia variegata]